MSVSARSRRKEGLTVAFMGLDGTGKSTQAELLQGSSWTRQLRPQRIHHASTTVPGLRALKLRYHAAAIRLLKSRRVHVEIEDRPESRSGGGTSLGSAISTYFLVGSYVKSVWYRRRYGKRLLILDRCFLDDVVKVRWRFGVKSELVGKLMRRAPKPDLVLVFESDPAVGYERKKSKNSTYEEYLQKGKVLDSTLSEAAEYGWEIRRVDIDGRNAEEVHEVVSAILQDLMSLER